MVIRVKKPRSVAHMKVLKGTKKGYVKRLVSSQNLSSLLQKIFFHGIATRENIQSEIFSEKSQLISINKVSTQKKITMMKLKKKFGRVEPIPKYLQL